MNPSIIVVGGGAVGLSLAWELARRDCEVTLIDRGEVGSGTTWTAAGILPPANLEHATDPMDRLRGLSHQLYPKWSEQLLKETSIDIELRRCGGWYLAETAGERALMAGMIAYWNEMQIQCDAVPLPDVARREPSLANWTTQTPSAAAWWVPDEYQIRPPRLTQALHAACVSSGVTIRQGCEVVDVASNDVASHDVASNRGTAVVSLADRTTIKADHAILCSGVWTGGLADRLHLNQSLIPIRGQMLLLKTDRPVIESIVNVGNRYVIAREDGHTLVGSCEEESGFDLSTDETMLETLHQFAIATVPSLRTASRVSAWSGLRPMTFDGFPMIGPVPSQPGLWVASGHYRSGIHLAPATAVTLADAILGERPAIDISSFAVGKQQVFDTSL
ncbi:Hydrogen cyanide synthase subunit HcnC precursor [Rubripirellula obstinata]|uniref:Hydrogen cyanide synthase subunit HcnC n=1 Tax=Rubripirellula obstinata TaxID=406547 RepID=A0A5B1CLT4_9BACT|nr:FAD-dependent oxidoreductase [Rubripirellula obstinata]KAA1260304.1 Hydrogen cyanide synthase subunit HcnC precursor [Rubripirellula obstinata]